MIRARGPARRRLSSGRILCTYPRPRGAQPPGPASGAPARAVWHRRFDRRRAGRRRVARGDGVSWVARVFPAARPLADVESEANLLEALERGGFPAERCADPEPLSFAGRAHRARHRIRDARIAFEARPLGPVPVRAARDAPRTTSERTATRRCVVSPVVPRRSARGDHGRRRPARRRGGGRSRSGSSPRLIACGRRSSVWTTARTCLTRACIRISCSPTRSRRLRRSS